MKVLITGGSGLVGKRLSEILAKQGCEIGWLSRSKRSIDQIRVFQWDVHAQTIDQKAIEWADGIIHLAGAGVADKRWTEARKKEILESRTLSTRLLKTAIEAANNKPTVFVSASAIGFYGFKTSDAWLTESSPAGNEFLAKVTVDWEKEVQEIEKLGITTSWIRVGIVLSKEGGALVEMTKPPVVAPLGSGKQWMPWIHIDDLCLLFAHALNNNLIGALNGVAPNPTLHHVFMKSLSKAASKVYLPIGVPAFALRIAVGEMAGMLTEGTRVSAKHTLSTGYTFQYPMLEDALNEIYQ